MRRPESLQSHMIYETRVQIPVGYQVVKRFYTTLYLVCYYNLYIFQAVQNFRVQTSSPARSGFPRHILPTYSALP